MKLVKIVLCDRYPPAILILYTEKRLTSQDLCESVGA